MLSFCQLYSATHSDSEQCHHTEHSWYIHLIFSDLQRGGDRVQIQEKIATKEIGLNAIGRAKMAAIINTKGIGNDTSLACEMCSRIV
jgi:hypothetical protein